MKHSRFKYVSKLEYAHLLLEGKAFHQTLGYFRDYEDSAAKQIIGDEFESTRLFRPVDGLQFNNQTRGTSGRVQMGFESSVRAGEIYVFCAACGLTDELAREFKAVACVEILDPRAFIERWQRALPPGAKHFAKKVDYYRSQDVPETVWMRPQLIVSTKLARFSYQLEYRLGFSTTGALDFGQCTQQLVDRKARPLQKPDEHHAATLNLGGLQDICTLHEL
jgi:hypothetical protein